ncbi:hypothetical protein B0T26DRAFT_726135 [Lasiosphaeria miniovina]|uniref:Uncharacterized protein n=1 Tax=Lasiosphaeria miniovina TaxID=1954250 RepID=A0AA40DJV6_9PEZI|nr:uncharacterized protein B0T26DRAFT_726135 [Lasiosphaeria miniovina]KAK0706294.1 hypothetical protein B0T26DRAFT_726135 [Lasiosphaeria miniovina]
MSCIHTYFTTLMGGLVDDLEDLVVDAVLTAPGVRRPPGSVVASSPDPPTCGRYPPIKTAGGWVYNPTPPVFDRQPDRGGRQAERGP